MLREIQSDRSPLTVSTVYSHLSDFATWGGCPLTTLITNQALQWRCRWLPASLPRVSQSTILNWKKGKTAPLPKDYPKLMRFLGGEVLPQGTTIAEHLRVARMRIGWSRKLAVKQLEVDESTLRDWEGGKVILLRKHRLLVAEFLGMPFEEVNQLMWDTCNVVHR